MDALFKKISTRTQPEQCAVHGTYESKAVMLGDKVLHWMRCPQCSAAAQAERALAQAKSDAVAAQQKLEARLQHAGIPLRYRAKTFASFVAANAGQAAALVTAVEFADHFAEHRRQGSVLVFSGRPGTGKSHLAIAIGHEVMRKGTVLYTSAIDAVRLVRDSWRRDAERSETQVLRMLAAIDLLILDEVGVQYGTEAEQISLFDIIDKRYRDLMPTILISNLGTGDMKAFLGERSYDRLREDGQWVKFDWDSQRGHVLSGD
ncbi:MAG: ATP-binding protein [Burkholderiaceae bacterium]|nr:ATP-binding protein [Burkholderiaceae bacterium]